MGVAGVGGPVGRDRPEFGGVGGRPDVEFGDAGLELGQRGLKSTASWPCGMVTE